MAEIRQIEGEVGPEILNEIGTGLVIIHASWSGPSVSVRNIAIQAAPAAGITKVFVLNADHAARFIQLFDQGGWTPCQGWGDLVFVRDGVVKTARHKFASVAEISPWLHSATTL